MKKSNSKRDAKGHFVKPLTATKVKAAAKKLSKKLHDGITKPSKALVVRVQKTKAQPLKIKTVYHPVVHVEQVMRGLFSQLRTEIKSTLDFLTKGNPPRTKEKHMNGSKLKAALLLQAAALAALAETIPDQQTEAPKPAAPPPEPEFNCPATVVIDDVTRVCGNKKQHGEGEHKFVTPPAEKKPTAAKKAAPKTETPPSAAAVSTAAPTTAAVATGGKPLADQLKEAAKSYVDLNGREALRTALNKYTQGSASDLPPDQQAAFLKDLTS